MLISVLKQNQVGFGNPAAAPGCTGSYLCFLGALSFGGAASLAGKSSMNRFNSCSVNALGANSALLLSLLDRAANCAGAITMCGVKKMMSSVFESCLTLCLKRYPNKGMSPRNGILLSDCILLFCMRPPMITGCPSGVTTTVSAERILMTGAVTPAARATVWSESSEICGETIISTMPSELMNGVTFRMIPTDWYEIALNGVPVSPLKLTLVTKGTDWPTVMVAG